MYEIRIDGQLLFSTAGVDDEHIILSPKLSPDMEGAGSLTFTMPPGHALYDGIRKLKGIVTVTQDDKTIFRGRVLDTETDFYRQKTVYCEGDLSFLLDSIYAPGVYTGKVMDFFAQLIEAHNEQVDEEKRFTIGVIDAVDATTPYEGSEQVETRVYWDTSTIIHDRLIGPNGGYLKTRTEGGVTYIDWLKKTGDTNGQVIEFAVNLLDLKDKTDASDVFTVLLPLGYTEMVDGEYTDPVTIASVNGGVEYIQNDEAVAMYGKIWRTKSWNWIEDPALLLQKARDYLKTGMAMQTVTLKLIDMRFITGNADAIQIGQYVRILSDPHGMDMLLPCIKIDLDLLNPENSTYTFGERLQTLTENVARTEEDVDDLTGRGRGGGGRGIQQEAQDIIRWAKIIVDEANGRIDLNTGEINKIEDRVKTAEIEIDGVNADILLTTQVTDQLGNRISAAEIEIDGLNSEINLKANKVTVDAEIADLSTAITDMRYAIAESISTKALTVNGNAWSSGTLTAGGLSAGSLTLNGNGISLSEATFLTSGTTLTVNSTGGTVTGVTLNKKTNTIYYLGW